MGDKSRLCVQCGRYISGAVLSTEGGPVHVDGCASYDELVREVERLRAENVSLDNENIRLDTEVGRLQAEAESLREGVRFWRAENERQRIAYSESQEVRRGLKAEVERLRAGLELLADHGHITWSEDSCLEVHRIAHDALKGGGE
jgi:predicted RNase H-like nuclease (RuvC/YqgF family)